MSTIASYLGNDHRRCDELFVETERVVAHQGAAAALQTHQAFAAAMARHFAMEEEILFPAFEQAMGVSTGPTSVMRHEHRQMRGLFQAMEAALRHGDDHGFLAASETLLILMQQHNAKEEQILYPMMDRGVSAAEREPLIARMEDLSNGAAC